MQHVTGLARDRTKVEVLLTAAEAYPALERAFLDAEREVWASFRIFDLRTRLRSPEARRVGDTWDDLIAHTLRRGVTIDMTIADFDPVARPSLHRGSWASLRRFLAAAEVSGAPERLRARVAMHPAATGPLTRAALWVSILLSLRRTASWLNAMGEAERAALLRDLPGLWDWIVRGRGGRLRPRLWGAPILHPCTHHQKLAVFDRERLYIGGLDLDERRWDTPDHDRPGDETWHDVQLMMEGPVVAEAQAHLETFLDVTAGRREPPPQRRLLRTLSRPLPRSALSFGPDEVLHEVLTAHEMLAARSDRLVYLESQFFRDTGLARTLARLAAEKPDLGLILILPAAPEEVAFGGPLGLDTRFGEFLQARCLRILEEGFGPRLFVGGAAQPRGTPRPSGGGALASGPEGKDGPPEGTGVPPEAAGRGTRRGAPLVYIHAKVSVFDDKAAVVSSANLNGRSLRWDTEAGVYLNHAQAVGRLREKVMRHWLPPDPDPRYFDLDSAVAMWRMLALRNARRRPEEREGFILPYDLDAAERLGRAVPGVPEAMV